MDSAAQPLPPADSLARRVRRAVIWRSGSQLAAQVVQWASTFLVIRILTPQDYGLFAMTQVVLVLFNMANGYGLASGLIQQREVTRREIGQLFGMLLVLNLALGLAQFALAPLAAAYYRQPEVADLLRVQALLYVTTPFIALPYALLSRGLEFRRQATANIAASIAGAATALATALAGWGVWTLVAAPLALFGVRAVMMCRAAGLVAPVFDFRGAGRLARFGGVIAAGQMFWFAQSQADIFIAGRFFSAHELGIYSTALLLTQIFVAKVIPPLNEVAFSAYARLTNESPDGERGLGAAFAHAARIVMLVAMPCYLGLAATAAPLVETVLGAKWIEAAPVVRLLALAMPFMTVQVLLSPACDARGRPGIGVVNGATGAALLIAAFAVGVGHGATGLACAWLAAYPLYLAISLWRSLPVIGTSARALADAVAPAVLAATAMALVVALVDRALPPLPAPPRLASEAIVGATLYGGWLAVFARDVLRQLVAVLRGGR